MTVGVGTPAWKCVELYSMPGVIHGERLQLRSMCTPDFGHSPLATSAARLGYKRQGGVSTILWYPWDISRRVFPIPGFQHFFVPRTSLSITVMDTDWKRLEFA